MPLKVGVGSSFIETYFEPGWLIKQQPPVDVSGEEIRDTKLAFSYQASAISYVGCVEVSRWRNQNTVDELSPKPNARGIIEHKF